MVSRLTFLIKDKPLTSLLTIKGKENFFLDTVIFGIIYAKSKYMNLSLLKRDIKKYIRS